jgi:DNA-binding NtrC family response regulator
MQTTKTRYPRHPVLVVDDEEIVLNYISSMLALNGINNVITCRDSRKVADIVQSGDIELVLLDLTLPHLSGEEVLGFMSSNYPYIPVIIVTGINDVQTAVKCMQAGAFDYMVKPLEQKRLISGVERTMELRALRRENDLLKRRVLAPKIEHPEAFSGIVTINERMHAIFRYIEAVASSRQPVLVTGESGVGKELIARSIHALSGLSGQFIAVNVAGLDDNMFSDTLFGHERGAFTGADSLRKGLIEQASDGTLFLDEIGDLLNVSQTKLLRLLQEKEYYALGNDRLKHSDARIVVATNRDLNVLQQKGEFRKDLYYRLRIHHVDVPPLRERKDDIPPLVDYFLKEAQASLDKPRKPASSNLYALFSSYDFPGNVRELQSMIFDAVSRSPDGSISPKSFAGDLHIPASTAEPETEAEVQSFTFPVKLPTLKEMSSFLVEEAMKRSNNSQTKAARLLGISQQALSKRLKQND